MGDKQSGAEQRPHGGALTMPPAPTVGVAEPANDPQSLRAMEAQLAPQAKEPAATADQARSTTDPPQSHSAPFAKQPPTPITELPTVRLEPAATDISQAPRMVDRSRAQTFGQALRILLQRRGLYVARTETYLLPQFHDRLKAVDGAGIQIASLREYLRGEMLPDEAKTRLIADALGAPRGLLLYVAGYLTPEDLAHYPGPQLTLATVEADIRELESLPLAPATKARIARDLRISARILCLLAPDRLGLNDGAPSGDFSTSPDEREQLIEQLIDLWTTPAPPIPSQSSADEGAQPTT